MTFLIRQRSHGNRDGCSTIDASFVLQSHYPYHVSTVDYLLPTFRTIGVVICSYHITYIDKVEIFSGHISQLIKSSDRGRWKLHTIVRIIPGKVQRNVFINPTEPARQLSYFLFVVIEPPDDQGGYFNVGLPGSLLHHSFNCRQVTPADFPVKLFVECLDVYIKSIDIWK